MNLARAFASAIVGIFSLQAEAFRKMDVDPRRYPVLGPPRSASAAVESEVASPRPSGGNMGGRAGGPSRRGADASRRLHFWQHSAAEVGGVHESGENASAEFGDWIHFGSQVGAKVAHFPQSWWWHLHAVASSFAGANTSKNPRVGAEEHGRYLVPAALPLQAWWQYVESVASDLNSGTLITAQAHRSFAPAQVTPKKAEAEAGTQASEVEFSSSRVGISSRDHADPSTAFVGHESPSTMMRVLRSSFFWLSGMLLLSALLMIHCFCCMAVAPVVHKPVVKPAQPYRLRVDWPSQTIQAALSGSGWPGRRSSQQSLGMPGQKTSVPRLT